MTAGKGRVQWRRKDLVQFALSVLTVHGRVSSYTPVPEGPATSLSSAQAVTLRPGPLIESHGGVTTVTPVPVTAFGPLRKVEVVVSSTALAVDRTQVRSQQVTQARTQQPTPMQRTGETGGGRE